MLYGRTISNLLPMGLCTVAADLFTFLYFCLITFYFQHEARCSEQFVSLAHKDFNSLHICCSFTDSLPLVWWKQRRCFFLVSWMVTLSLGQSKLDSMCLSGCSMYVQLGIMKSAITIFMYMCTCSISASQALQVWLKRSPRPSNCCRRLWPHHLKIAFYGLVYYLTKSFVYCMSTTGCWTIQPMYKWTCAEQRTVGNCNSNQVNDCSKIFKAVFNLKGSNWVN